MIEVVPRFDGQVVLVTHVPIATQQKDVATLRQRVLKLIGKESPSPELVERAREQVTVSQAAVDAAQAKCLEASSKRRSAEVMGNAQFLIGAEGELTAAVAARGKAEAALAASQQVLARSASEHQAAIDAAKVESFLQARQPLERELDDALAEMEKAIEGSLRRVVSLRLMVESLKNGVVAQ
jgi:hypothetical protein